MKYIFISGGVVSGLGKGITSASIGLILKNMGVAVTNVKIDMYLNVDAGTIRPQEHGEVFVTEDGLETDQDLGNYERFTGQTLHRENYITTGQIYKTVIDRERAFGYGGEDVEAVPHVTDEIIRRLELAGKKNHAKVVIVELGGTVGEYQNGIFFEASRILKLRQPKDVIQIHVTYLPFLKNIGELKSKPAQQSTHILNAMGIQPDFLVARSEKEIDTKRKEKLAVFCNLQDEDIIGSPDLPSIYQVPLYMEDQRFGEKILHKLRLRARRKAHFLAGWKKFEHLRNRTKKEVKIAMVGKYFATGDYKLSDSYISVIEALKQAAWTQGINPLLDWIDSEDLEKKNINLSIYDGIIVPQGWGSRGTEGKLLAVKQAREKNIPYLGLCFGMQMAVIEFARNIAHLKGANSTEANPKTLHPVIHIMPEQVEYLAKKQYGGTIRLGSWPCVLKKRTKLFTAYEKYSLQKDSPWLKNNDFKSKATIYERHRHRYEFNNHYRDQLEKAGLIISGLSPDDRLVEAIELPDHPFFVGTQFHPEYIARPLTPHPIFMAFLAATTAFKDSPRRSNINS
ncbi:MAG: CTP synthetase [Candidatus Collierbacteria bacterium GW2011_GWB1_45_35]|uniref:CTP synthase n=2 Tax=Candidatus Collieribacteriota TaxID=1752725 RepID=A0A0G1NR39_9BACT|nr:MAG: CTP synthetase [Microgenomates group bacterium GW2011_GWC1_44_23]KKT86654.1 MAG: CTP synthetase [Candidatus Collierbacteria bacterium GW2011_GWA2_44_99]KKT95390.1 MAG: CTP synthetase [Candidatus Collierbacteria bacterium GW2011_GWA1_45_15]KKU00040.1 MAG: CTP synthetase [Candidatus Collierbacteria bacterium GW2011_GWB2_45_17]KKU05139.1 MAG: CTP synthetase [Candidatus Collierbacteria bacterium GW2011_GWB1_45_35]KKU08433.1 MAG: CTP synthetase [Candidatus Collierbacteria bacterium GW2011_G